MNRLKFFPLFLILFCCLWLPADGFAQGGRVAKNAASRLARQETKHITARGQAAVRAQRAAGFAAAERMRDRARTTQEQTPQVRQLGQTLRQAEIRAKDDAWETLRRLRRHKNYYKDRYFERFMVEYYLKHFTTPTPKLIMLIRKIGQTRSVKLEDALFNRMSFLARYANSYLEHAPRLGDLSELRLFYKGKADPKLFDPAKLMYEYEIKIPHGEFVPLAAGWEESRFTLNGQTTHIAGFDLDLSLLPQLYLRLLHLPKGQYPRVWFSPKEPLFILSNHRQTRWIRVARHEIARVSQLHIHLYWMRALYHESLPHAETAVFNISIPVSGNKRIPLQHQDLYQKFIGQPLAFFTKRDGAAPDSGYDF